MEEKALSSIKFLFFIFAGSAVWAFLMAFITQVITKNVAKFKPTYWSAYRAIYFACFSATLTGFYVGLIVGAFKRTLDGTGVILILIIAFFVQSTLYFLLLKSQDNEKTDFCKACIISLIELVTYSFIIFLIIAGYVAFKSL